MANAMQQRPAGNTISLVLNKDTLKGVLDKPDFVDSIRAVASQYITADRATKVALLACSRQPKLWQCTIPSFVQAVIKATELGLEFGGSTGQGYLVPYKNGYLSKQMGRDVYEVQFIPGYRGFIELAYRSGNIRSIDVQLVYEKDEFDYGLGDKPFVRHKPFLGDNRGKLICAYSVIWLKDSPIPKIDFMTVQELEKIRNCSKSKDDGPWCTFPEEMQKKSILRRSFKWIPTTAQISLAEELDNQDYDLTKAAVITPGPNQQLGSEGTRNRMLAAMGQVPPAAEPAVAETEFMPQGDGEPAYDFADSVVPEDQMEPPAQSGPVTDQQSPQENRGYTCDANHAFAEPKMTGKRPQCPQCLSTRIQKL
jgi:recombination protein RecT